MRSLLFVDDDPMVLSALRRALRCKPDWDLKFAGGVSEAAQRVSAGHFDAVIADMQMDDGTGMDVLRYTMENQPEAARLILTAHCAMGVEKAADCIVHQFMSKPWDLTGLIDTISRTLSVRDLLEDPALRRGTGSMKALPSAPCIVTQFHTMLARSSTTAAEMATVLEQDPAMTAKVLQLANSPFFGTCRTMARARDAVVYLGSNLLRDLVTGIAIFQAFDGQIKDLDVDRMQQEDFACGQLARKLFRHWGFADETFSAILLRRIGLLITASQLPQYYHAMHAEAASSNLSIQEVEYEKKGISHAHVGAYLLGLWGLPYDIVEAVANQYRPRPPQVREFDLIDAVYVIVALTSGKTVDPAWLNSLGALDKLDGWMAAVREYQSEQQKSN